MSYFYSIDEFNTAMEGRQKDSIAEAQAKAAFISGKVKPQRKPAKTRKKHKKKKQGFIHLLTRFFLTWKNKN